jgi:hypothetical protein
VTFTSTDLAAALPSTSALASGTRTFTVTLKTAGSQTVTATDTVATALSGTCTAIGVSPAAASVLQISAPASAAAGSGFSVTVTAKDPYGNTASGYAGTVAFSSTDANAVLPANSALISGSKSFTVTLKTAGSQTVTATDTVAPSLSATTPAIGANPAAASTFQISLPPSAAAGAAFPVTVTAKDPYGNTATGYAGTVTFSSTDPNAVLPANSALVSGSKSFTVTLKTAGSQTVTATDTVTTSLSGTSPAVSVSALAASSLQISAPASVIAGVGFPVTVTAKDPYGNTATGYAGTVTFSSTDANAVLPANSSLPSGTGTFSVTLKTAGSQTITATDTVAPSLSATTPAIGVNPAPASALQISAPASAAAGSGISVTVTAKDPYGNTATGYAGTVTFSSADPNAVLPANSSLPSGTRTFSVTLKTAGGRTVTATDTVAPGLSATTQVISVSPGAAAALLIGVPPTATVGSAFPVTVIAHDAYGNLATGYAGTVTFSSTDPDANLPKDSTLTAGSENFSLTLNTIVSQTITVSDTVAPSLTVTSPAITVDAGSAPVSMSFAGVTISQVSPPPGTGVTPGATFTVSMSYFIQDVSCPGCIDQIQIGWAHDPINSVGCIYNGIPGPEGVSGSGSLSFIAPTTPGTYSIGIDRSQQYFCQSGWWSGPPTGGRLVTSIVVR